MKKFVTLNEYIASLQKIAQTHGDEEVLSLGSVTGTAGGLQNPRSIHLINNGKEQTFYVPCFKEDQSATHTKTLRIKVGETTYQFRIAYGDTPSPNGIFLGKITELELRTEKTGKVVADYKKGWKLEPKTKSALKAVEILLHNFN